MTKPRGMHYVKDKELVWKRVQAGEGFRFINRLGRAIKKKDAERIKDLVIPPAWQDVRVSPDPFGHIQAVGIDDKGRKQYIYHPAWVEFNQQHKFDSLKKFGEILPNLRETIAGHMRQHELTRERILATVVWLLEHTFIRVGNKEYADENQSYGLTTMRTKHVDVEGSNITFSFKGKSHVYHELDIRHPRVAQTIKECIELPGYQIFKYVDGDKRKAIDSADVNEYLKEISGESLSAKDFRTWGGTTLAGESLYKIGEPTEELSAEKALVQAVAEVAEHLGNTVAVCRQYYIHPRVIESYEQKKLVPHFDKIAEAKSKVPNGLAWEEYATWSLLEK
jgi:DNA topoisomerase-1